MRTLLASALLLITSTTFASGRCLNDFKEMENLSQVIVNQNMPRAIRELSLVSQSHELNQVFKKAVLSLENSQKVSLLYKWQQETKNYYSQTLTTLRDFQQESGYIGYVANNVFFCLETNQVACKPSVEEVYVQQTKINKQYFEIVRDVMNAYDSLNNYFQNAIETLSKGGDINENDLNNSLKGIEKMSNSAASYRDSYFNVSRPLAIAVDRAKACLTEN